MSLERFWICVSARVCSAVWPCRWIWTLIPRRLASVWRLARSRLACLTKCGTSLSRWLIWVLTGLASSTPIPPTNANPGQVDEQDREPARDRAPDEHLDQRVEDQRDRAGREQDQQDGAGGARERPQAQQRQRQHAPAGSSAAPLPAAARRPRCRRRPDPRAVDRGSQPGSSTGASPGRCGSRGLSEPFGSPASPAAGGAPPGRLGNLKRMQLEV